MTALTTSRIAELRALHAAATPGEWTVAPGYDGDSASIEAGPGGSIDVAILHDETLRGEDGEYHLVVDGDKNAAWIVAACNELPGALAEIERLRNALQLLHDDTDEYQRINNLGGHDNHVMKLARAALEGREA